MTSPQLPAEELALRDFEALRRLANSLLSASACDREDFVQEAWLRTDARSEKAPAKRGYLATVLRNVQRSSLRARARRTEHEASAGRAREPGRAGDTPLDAALRLETARVLIDAVAGLDEPYRSAITMRYFEGKSPRAIAAHCSCPTRTVHTRLRRGLELLRTRLSARYGDRRAYLAALIPFSIMTTNKTTLGGILAGVTVACLGSAFALGAFDATPADAGPPEPVVRSTTATPSASRSVDQPLQRQTADGDESTEQGALTVTDFTVQLAVTRLHGHVIDLLGNPVAGVTLANDPGQYAQPGLAATQVTVSDAEGHFVLELGATPAGRLQEIDANWIGVYEPELWGIQGTDTPELTVVVAQPQKFQGIIVDGSTGEPLEGVQLNITANMPTPAGFDQDLSRSRAAEWRTVSAAGGAFALEAPMLDRLQIHGALPGYEHLHVDLESPSTSLRLELQPSGALLRGQVVDARGKPAAGAAVLCGPAATEADEQGNFTIDLTHVHAAPGSASHRQLIAARYGELPGSLYGPETGWRSQENWPQPLIVRLGERSLDISGRVTNPDGTPVEGIQVRVLDEHRVGSSDSLPGSQWTAESLARTQISIESDQTVMSETAVSMSPGGFGIGGLQPRAYRLRVQDHRTLRAMVTQPVQAGQSGVELELPSETLWPSVGGVLVDRRGNPVANAGVQILRHFEDVEGLPHLEIWLHTDADGRFRTQHPVSSAATTLLAQAPDTSKQTRFDLGEQSDPANLRLVVPVSLRVRVEATTASRAAARIEFRNAENEPVPTLVQQGNVRIGQHSAELVDGRTAVLMIDDSATTAILWLESGAETRQPLSWDSAPLDEVHILRL